MSNTSLSPRALPQSELLEALAARCEREDSSWELCIDIELAIRRGATRDDMKTGRAIRWGHKRYNPPEYAFSLDAAVTLVPEKWSWRVDGGRAARVSIFGDRHSTKAKTPALALCAAALRARAAAAEHAQSSDPRGKAT
jgi:hypothetical protein